MVRIIAFLVGLGFVGVLLISLVVNALDYFQNPPAPTAEHEFHRVAEPVPFSFKGPFGKYDQQQLQRGFQVYKEVCAACHSLKFVSFYELEGLGYNEAEIKAIANQWAIEVPSVNPETGEAATRKALASDRFPSPYPNETGARAANNNAFPPDLSLIAKAREGGADYIHALLMGYQNQPAELLRHFPDAKTGAGLHYNPYFANLNIAMPPPLTADGQVTYADGTTASRNQMATDVAAFLAWTSEPNLDRRHAAGWAVLIFLTIATLLGYLAYRNVWAEAKRKVAPKGPLDPEHRAMMNEQKADAGVAG